MSILLFVGIHTQHSSQQEKAECDRSFTRSDALAKHMRMQHHVDTLPTVRGSGAAPPPSEKKPGKKSKVENEDGDDGEADQPLQPQQQQQKEEESVYIDQADEMTFQSIVAAPGEPFYYPHFTLAAAQYQVVEENNELIRHVLSSERYALEQLEQDNDRILSELLAIEINEKASDEFFKELSLPKVNRSLKSTNNHYRSGPHVVYHEIQTEDVD